MSTTHAHLNNALYPPLTADITSTSSVVNGQTVKVDIAVIDATRLTGGILNPGQVAQIITDVHADMP